MLKKLTFNDVYPCPICQGKITNLTLMEAFYCNFCQHIFTANLEQQVITMADNSEPISWFWNGKKWRGANRQGIELGWGVLIGAFALVLLPTSLISFAVYLFPPIPDVPLYWFPYMWIGLTFICHLWFVLSLISSYYQWSLWLYLKGLYRGLWR